MSASTPSNIGRRALTVGLKTIGLLALMAQAGIPVPAVSARLPIFDGVLADIGDYQSIEQNLSTFSAHVTNIDFISRTATTHSLVLLDGLGSATDPEEGAALAVAIADHFRRSGALSVISTHHTSLKVYAANTQGVLNAAVGNNEIIYRKQINVGIAVALDWGLIVPVIKNADNLSLTGLTRSLNDLADRARNKRLDPREVQDGTFTITNPAVFGSLIGTPIINQPQVGILGTGSVVKRAVMEVGSLSGGRSLIRYSRLPVNTAAYILSNRGARKWLTPTPRCRPNDVDIRYAFLSDLNVLGVYPAPAFQGNDFPSVIGGTHTPHMRDPRSWSPGPFSELYLEWWTARRLGLWNYALARIANVANSARRRVDGRRRVAVLRGRPQFAVRLDDVPQLHARAVGSTARG
jgi:hypothetical protein